VTNSANDLYKHPLWQRKRLEILQRDNWSCIACGDKTTTLHVHHLMYDGAPWEVLDNYLQTLCEPCHQNLGPHPKGGVYYQRKTDTEPTLAVTVHWCPQCGSNQFNDKGSYLKCSKCSWRSDIYSSFNITQNIKIASNVKAKPKEYSLGWVKGMIAKVKKGGASDLDIFNAIFPSHPASDVVLRMCECAKRLVELQLDGGLSYEQEVDAVSELIKCRREIEDLLAVGYGESNARNF
jgi:ribosomal protein L37AE/L43A